MERIAGTLPTPGNPEAPQNALFRRTYVDLSGPVGLISMADFRKQPLNGTSSKNDSDFTNAGPVTQINNIWTTLNNAGMLTASGATLDAQTISAGGNTFDSNSRGYEFELVANPTRNWRLSLNYSANKLFKSNIGNAIVSYLDSKRAFFTQGDRSRLVINGTNQLSAWMRTTPGRLPSRSAWTPI